MKRKHSNYMIIGVVTAALVLMFGLNVMAAHDGKIPYETDMSNRTMLKEILTNQKTTHALLGEIKGLLQEAK